MKLARMLSASLAIIVSASAFAQFGSEEKKQVLAEIGHVMKQEAFVPGVDLGKWDTFIAKKDSQIEGAESAGQFSSIVNSALREFGLSHIQLMRRGRRGGEESLSAVQGFRQMPSASVRWIDNDSALFRLPSFDRGYDEKQIEELFGEVSAAKNLVLDLRGNPGGEVEKMRQFLGFLVPSNTPIGTFVSRPLAKEYAKSANAPLIDPIAIAAWAKREFRPRRVSAEPFKGKIAVLVDGYSASASEIVANALREKFQSPIIGAPTAGAVLVSTFNRLSYGFQIQYPVGDYVSYGGMRIEGRPLRPDVDAKGAEAIAIALSKLKS